jgi:GDPmannose 4,6-dehydratase
MPGPVLIVGALGQDGRLLAERLRAAGEPVIGVARPGAAPAAPPPFPLIALDVGDDDAVAAAIATHRPRRLFYLAAVHHSAEGPPADPQVLWPAMLHTNCRGVAAVLRALRRAAPECRLVFAASSQMYTPPSGPGTGDLTVDETTARRPRTFYGHTKSWSLDAIAEARARGLAAGTAILFNHESPLRPPSFLSRKVTRAAAAIRLGRQHRLAIDNLGGRADWSSAHDVVDALLRMSEGAPGDYVIGSGRLHTVEDLLGCAFAQVGLDWRDHVDATRRIAQPAVVADPRRVIADLGWQPRQDFASLIRAMVDADRAALSGSPDP